MKTIDKNIPLSSKVGIPLLANPYRDVANLRLIEKKSYKEIAEIIGITEERSRNCVMRAKRKLFKLDSMLKNYNGDEEVLKKILENWIKVKIDGRYMIRK